MNESIQAAGMVLSAAPIGEYDKRLVILTREEGKITAFARGARRQKSTLLAPSNPFVTGTFSLFPGRSAYRLTGVSVQNYFTELSALIPGIYYGFYFLELASYYGREGIDGTETLNLLYLTLKALENPSLDDVLVRRIYEIRLMSINGDYAPDEARLGKTALYVCRYIMQSPLTKLYTFTVEPDVLGEIGTHADRLLQQAVDRRIRSLEILEQFL